MIDGLIPEEEMKQLNGPVSTQTIQDILERE